MSSKSNNKELELLLPAGDEKKAEYALRYGADAIYAGMPVFSLRKKENRFNAESLKRTIKKVKKQDKKIYLTANIYLRWKFNPKPFLKQVEDLYAQGADAFIVSDPGIIMLIKDNLPHIPLHLSVQANSTNPYSAMFWKKQGIERIILPRELTLDEIRDIKKQVPEMELEFFVHGAICMAYSGRCLLSAYLAGRDANLGMCAQPCRWRYRVYVEEIQRPGELMLVEEDKNGTYIFNSRDFCLIRKLKDLAEAGIESFKVEGRNKNLYYISAVARAYRKAIDILTKNEWDKGKVKEIEKELMRVPNRGYICDLMNSPTSPELQNYDNRISQAIYEFLGVITSKKGRKWEVEVKNKIIKGMDVEIITPTTTLTTKIKRIVWKGKEVGEVSGGEKAIIEFLDEDLELEGYEIIRKKEEKKAKGLLNNLSN